MALMREEKTSILWIIVNDNKHKIRNTKLEQYFTFIEDDTQTEVVWELKYTDSFTGTVFWLGEISLQKHGYFWTRHFAFQFKNKLK